MLNGFFARFFIYGSFKEFREVWILSAMNTSNSKFLAQMLYTKTYIDEVININKIIGDIDKTNRNILNTKFSDEIIIKKIIGDKYIGYLMTITDPRRLELVSSKRVSGDRLERIISDYKAIAGMNASGFNRYSKKICSGISIYNEVIKTNCKAKRHQLVGMNDKNTLLVGQYSNTEIAQQKFKWAAEFGPVLVVNGEKVKITNFMCELAPRTGLGQTKDGKILLLVIDGRQFGSIGATFKDAQNVLFDNGAINAFNRDGGNSTSMFYNNKIVDSPSEENVSRELPNALIVK